MRRAPKLFLGAIAAGLLAALLSSLPRLLLYRRMTMVCQQASKASDRDVLPTNVKPIHYDLLIKSDMDGLTYTGRVAITLEVLKNTKIICLNGNDLDIKSIEINGKAAQEFKLDSSTEILSVGLASELEAGGNATMIIEFGAIINDKMAGYYRSAYVNEDGEKRVMAATQFEATDARRAFPCWDEPAVKARFSISLDIPDHLVGLSNMNEESRKVSESGRVLIRFHKTPIMSTYLVAWAVGDLEYIEAKNANGTPVRVYAVKGSAEQGRFALDVATRTLDFFTEYFDQSYPLPKMDLIAIPDFAAGAMENWGLVTFRTITLLVDERQSSLATRQHVAYVVAHELAHQWFGNLVTMDWWGDLWLNEGFATWVGWLAADHLFPAWDVWTQFIVEETQEGLGLDGLRASHPIEVPVKSPSEIGQIFDSISYAKGAAVIHMLVSHLGEDSFRAGMRAYLKKHAYGNAETQDLWTALSQSSGQPVNSIMSNWTREMGYPVIEISLGESKKDDTIELHLKQSRFLNSGMPSAEEDKVLWTVPLLLATDSGLLANSKSLLAEKSAGIQMPADAAYFKLNYGQAGFYRVQYPDAWLERLGKAVPTLAATDRIGIVADAFALAKADRIPLVSALNLLACYANEQDYLVWSEIAAHLSSVLSVWFEESKETIARLKTFGSKLVAPTIKRLGFDFKDNEEDKTRLLRVLAIGLAGRCGDEEVIREAKLRFEKFKAGDKTAIHPNLRGTIYGIVVRAGGKSEFDDVYRIYEQVTIADQKMAALGALGASTDLAVIKTALDLALSPAVRSQDAIYLFRTVGANHAGRRAAFEFLSSQWTTIYGRYHGGSPYIFGRIVASCTDSFATIKDAEAVEKFLVGKDTKSIDRTVKQSLEKILANASFLTKNRTAVEAWLNKTTQ